MDRIQKLLHRFVRTDAGLLGSIKILMTPITLDRQSLFRLLLLLLVDEVFDSSCGRHDDSFDISHFDLRNVLLRVRSLMPAIIDRPLSLGNGSGSSSSSSMKGILSE